MVSCESCVLPMPYQAVSVWLKEAAARRASVANWPYHLLARLGPSEVGPRRVTCWRWRQPAKVEEAVGATAASGGGGAGVGGLTGTGTRCGAARGLATWPARRGGRTRTCRARCTCLSRRKR